MFYWVLHPPFRLRIANDYLTYRSPILHEALGAIGSVVKISVSTVLVELFIFFQGGVVEGFNQPWNNPGI